MPPPINLVGHTYGDFTVLQMIRDREKKRTYCKCVGIDGNEYIIRADALRSGSTVSIKGACNTGNKKDITGKTFGYLTAIKPTDKRAHNGCIIWEFKCKCGNNTEASIGNVLRGHTLSCGCKKSSKWEEFIAKCLDSMNINFIQQYTFADCLNIQKNHALPFDFYLPDYNIAIEYDGEQHVKPIDMYGGEEKFKIQKRNDGIKDNYCLSNGINLIRIPHTYKEKDIINVLNDIMRPATITA